MQVNTVNVCNGVLFEILLPPLHTFSSNCYGKTCYHTVTSWQKADTKQPPLICLKTVKGILPFPFLALIWSWALIIIDSFPTVTFLFVEK